jgi:hypothetical protein
MKNTTGRGTSNITTSGIGGEGWCDGGGPPPNLMHCGLLFQSQTCESQRRQCELMSGSIVFKTWHIDLWFLS